MNGYFITGTDTDVGKTIATASLLQAFLKNDTDCIALKPVQTGCRDDDNELIAEDVEMYAAFTKQFFPNGYPEACSMKFRPACSPHLAAQMAETSIELAPLVADILHKGKDAEIILVEGAGGVMVPLSSDATMLDLMKRLNLPVIIVADNKLGMINHTLMSIASIRNAGLDIAGVIINNTTPTSSADEALRKDNIQTVAAHGNVTILGELPHAETIESLVTCTPLASAALLLKDRNAAAATDSNFDRDHLWHPYTSATNPLPTTAVQGARGTRLVLEDGREVIDGMASWWCAIHGYGHPALDQAARSQIGRMSHVMFGGLTHDPAVSVCAQLLDMAPTGLEHVFLADSGSVSVEVAIKMALQYMQTAGQTARTKLFTVRGGYHGDTCGAMSVCDPDNGMHHLFSGLLPQQIFAPRPMCRFGEEWNPDDFTETARLFKERAGDIAAIIVEPIVQGAGGMWFYHPEYLKALRELADEHDVLLILDEIATGFGRTGKLFACEWADITPDIMCVGKALSGGYMTLAATLATADVATTISADGGVLMHGPTFMGNPLACSVAKASLDLLNTNDWQQQVANIQGWLETSLSPCRDLEGVADVRVLGAIGVVELEESLNIPRLQKFFIEQGVWLRPFGRLLYLMPPYIITQSEIEHIGATIFSAIKNRTYQ